VGESGYLTRKCRMLTVGGSTATYNGWMPARPDPAQLAAWRRLLEAHATVTELLEHELVAERGLPLSRYDVLLNLAEAPGGRLRMQELSASVLLGIHEHFTCHLSPEEVEVLTAALSRVVAAARAATEPTPTGAQAQVSDQAQLAGAGSAADHR
jgi:hypothetical protein